MKRMRLTLSLLLIVAMLFSACASTNGNDPATKPTDSTPTTVTDPTTTDPTVPGTDPTDPVSTTPTDPVSTTPTDPTDPVSTSATDPVSTDATDPVSTSATDPVATDATDPTEPPATQATEPPATQATNPPATQPTNPPATQPTNPPATQPTNPPATQPTNPPATQPTNPPATQPTNPPATQGTGTQSDPFLIRNLQDLMNLQKVVNKSGYYYRQVADIDCSSVGNWIVIGDENNPFRHNYDGGGYTISNLCLDGEAQALFSRVENSHFKNMNIVNAHTKDNHRTEENRTDKLPGGGESTAAIVGYGSGCSFENCTATVNFLSSNSCTGGLIGAVELKNEKYTLMKNCHVSGTITSGGYAGGLIGNISTYLSDGDYKPAETITVENCSADVEIIIFTTSIESPCVGGLIGKSFGVFIEKCHTKGSINVISGDIGGLIGDAGNYTDVTRCYSTVDIYASSDNHYGGVSIGGLIGHIYSRSDVYDCYATGDITAPYVEWSPCQDSTNRNGGPRRKYYNPCGSLIGTLEVFKAYSEDQKINVYNCYATGKVDVPNICEDKRVYCHGALIGLVLDSNTVLASNIKDTSKKELTWDDFKDYYIGNFGNNYNLEDLRTYYEPINEYQGANTLGLQNAKYKVLPQHEYVEIITEQQLHDQSTFEGWDFVNIWKMTANGPVLR